MTRAESLASQAHTPSLAGHDHAAIRFEDRLLAEAVATLEQSHPELIDDSVANAAARSTSPGSDLEQRIIIRARTLSIGPELTAALHHVRQALGWILIAGIVMVLCAGAATARAALGSPYSGEPVNFFWAFGSMLGVQTLILLIWLGLIIVLPRV